MKLGFIGAGNMAGGIIGGIVGKGLMKPAEIGIFDVAEEKMAEYSGKGHPVYGSVQELVSACDTIFIAVKPQNFTQILPMVAEVITVDKLLVSIAAGITAQTIKTAMGFDCKLVLAMPNTPLLLGYGATALARIEPTTEEEFASVRALFDAAGVTGEVPANKMNEVIPVNGSSPAFIYLFAKLMIKCAENNGIDTETATKLFCQTMIGSAHMLMESGMTPQELIKMVCSPGGTTLAGMRALEDKGFAAAVESAVEACIARAQELSAVD